MTNKERLVVGVPALPETFEIGLAAGHMEAKPTLYESLVGYQLEDYPGGIQGAAIRRPDRFVGRLAESWEVSPDGRVVTMRLREGVKSVGGKLLDAADVKYTLDRGFNVPGYYKWTAQVAGLASNDDVEVVDRLTVRFSLATPSAFFLDTRVFPMNGIFDSDLVSRHAGPTDPWALGWLEKHDAGFGPYTIADYRSGERLVYRARDDYYRGKPAFDEVVYRVIPDEQERVDRLVLGEIDTAHALPTSQLLRLRERLNVRVVFGPSTSVFQLALHCQSGPLADVHLRRAIAFAVPYELILKQVFFGVARPWRGLIPPVIEGYDESHWPYSTDLTRAREELDQAAASDDFCLTILGNESSAVHRATATRIVNALAEIGVAAREEMLPTAEYIRRKNGKEFVAALGEAGPMVPDAGYALSHDFQTHSEGNDFGYSNASVDDLVDRGLAELDRTKRLARYREAQDLLAADVPVIPIASPGFATAVSTRLAGVAWYPDNVLHFGEIRPKAEG